MKITENSLIMVMDFNVTTRSTFMNNIYLWIFRYYRSDGIGVAPLLLYIFFLDLKPKLYTKTWEFKHFRSECTGISVTNLGFPSGFTLKSFPPRCLSKQLRLGLQEKVQNNPLVLSVYILLFHTKNPIMLYGKYRGSLISSGTCLVWDIARQPVKTFIQSLAWSGTSSLDVPASLISMFQ